VSIDGSVVAKASAAERRATVPLAALGLGPGSHVLSVAAEGCTTNYGLSYKRLQARAPATPLTSVTEFVVGAS
jgi:hypothetical protein